MASITRYQNPPVTDALRDEPYSFDFDQAVIVLEHMNKLTKQDKKETLIPLGDSCDLTREALTIKSHVSFATPASELQQLDTETETKKPTLWINFLGLAGALGPLPTPYTEMVIDRTRVKDTSFRDFLDIFNHRVAGMWHRLHKKVHVGIAQVLPQHSSIGKCLLRLAGISHERIIDGTALTETALLTYQSLLWKQPHGGIGLEQMINHHFGVNTKVHNFEGAWRTARFDEISCIGTAQGQWNTLGQTVILGSKGWDQMAGIRIDIGSLTWNKFCAFLPTSRGKQTSLHERLKDLCQLYVGLDFSISVRLILDHTEIKPTILESQIDHTHDSSFRLGLNTWLYRAGTTTEDVSTQLRF
ncbi:MAG: type VI secretion system baseplate subunit TssG [Pseudomonadota bacterium]